MDIPTLIDEGTKLVGATCAVFTLYLAWSKILPKLTEIHQQTNSLAEKAQAGAHAEGVNEGIRQATDLDPTVAFAAKVVLDAVTSRMAPPPVEPSVDPKNER